MRVSVIIPTYNRAEMLREALDSVLAQTFQDFEILVVDDGSDDHTPEVLTQYAGRVQSIRLGRSGIGAARNAGIERASGDYLAFLDSDDLWKPDKLAHQFQFAQQHLDCAVTYTDAIQFSDHGEQSGTFVQRFPALRHPANLFASMIRQNAIPLTSTVLIQSSFLRRTGLRFPVEVAIGEDLVLFLQILMADGAFSYLPETLTFRRMHTSNVSGNHCRRFRERQRLYSFGYLRALAANGTPKQRAALAAGLREATFKCAECDWEDFRLAEARKKFFEVVGFDRKGARALAYGMLTYLPSPWLAGLRKLKTPA